MDFYKKYIKYKAKYLNLLYGGHISVDQYKKNIKIINDHFNGKDLCSNEDLYISNIQPLTSSVGAAKGYGGASLYFGLIENIPVTIKFFQLYQEIHTSYIKGINEIGLTHYISDYFLINSKLTDNFTIFYKSIKCDNYLSKNFNITNNLINNYCDNKKQKNNTLINNDTNIMIVEKVAGDLKNYFNVNKDKSNFIKIFVSLFIQICYTLLVFQKKCSIFCRSKRKKML
jgi:hypothetical protein